LTRTTLDQKHFTTPNPKQSALSQLLLAADSPPSPLQRPSQQPPHVAAPTPLFPRKQSGARKPIKSIVNYRSHHASITDSDDVDVAVKPSNVDVKPSRETIVIDSDDEPAPCTLESSTTDGTTDHAVTNTTLGNLATPSTTAAKATKHRARHKWTESELSAFLEAVYVHGVGCWDEISKSDRYGDALARRTRKDLKDKWRNLLRSRTKDELLSRVVPASL